MNFLQWLGVLPPPPPVPPPGPASAERMAAVRSDAVAVFTAIRQERLATQRRERERQRQQEKERRRREAEEAAHPKPSDDEQIRFRKGGDDGRRYSVASDNGIRFQRRGGDDGRQYSIAPGDAAPRFSIAPSLHRDFESAFGGFDARAFSRFLAGEVRRVYGGNPVPFYTAAGLSRSAYSKLISHPDRHPAKDTVLAMAATLKMDLPAAKRFLELAGYALSASIPSDIVWRLCFERGIHNLPQIRELLSEFASKPAAPSI